MLNEKISIIETVAQKFIYLPDSHEKDFILGFMEGVQAERAKNAEIAARQALPEQARQKTA